MKGGGLGRPPPDAGIPTDMKTLLNAFRDRNSLRLTEFYEVAVNFGLKDIYAGRMSVADLVGFEECLLNAAFAYTRPRKEYPNGLGEEQTLTERIFGIYATFVLYYAQPIDYVSKIHITPEDCDNLVDFTQGDLINGHHLDAYGCVHRLFADDAFRLVMFAKNHDLSNHRRYEKPNPVEVLLDEHEHHVPLETASGIMKHPLLKAMKYVDQKMEGKERMLFQRRIADNDKTNFLARLQNIYASLIHELHKADYGTGEDIYEKWKEPSSPTFCKTEPDSDRTKLRVWRIEDAYEETRKDDL
ncbi:hypothetical protein GCK32_002838 [Trichostrongylus colubriformis]|uniref:Uncharacterized protein n=1 Tax=Trichostrongylus colubriformis TaxID=6319 RepID=A0AAN8J2W3_TRICO